MVLSKRLTKVLEYIDATDRVADIGADHGYLTLSMINKGVKFAQVVENKIEPLKRAQKTLADYNFVRFSLSDGISKLDPNVNVVTICGMGGLNIVEILSNNIKRAKKLDKLVLQANSKVPNLREFLNNNGFSIIDEEIVLDKGTYYEIIIAKFEDVKDKLSNEELYFGPILLQKKSNEFILKYKKQLEEFLEIIKNPNISNLESIDNLNQQINLIKKRILGD